MADSTSDDELIRLTRAYLVRRRGQSPHAGLEDDAMAFVFMRPRAGRLASVLGAVTVILASALAAVVVLAFHRQAAQGTAGSAAQGEIHVVRTPGLLVLPLLDRIITDPQLVAQLGSDIRGLPPKKSLTCGTSWNTTYTLTFTAPGTATWTAVISVWGCETVNIGTGPLLSWAHTSVLWSDLGAALGLPTTQLLPMSCSGSTPDTSGVCYPQSPLPTSLPNELSPPAMRSQTP